MRILFVQDILRQYLKIYSNFQKCNIYAVQSQVLIKLLIKRLVLIYYQVLHLPMRIGALI